MTKTTDLQRYKLISGHFSPDEARQVLTGLVEYKIGFHRLKNWSQKERLGASDSFSENRILELERIKAELEALIDQLADSGSKLSVNCDICVEVVDGDA